MNTTIYSKKQIEAKKIISNLIVFTFLVFSFANISAQDIKLYKVENELSRTTETINNKEIDMSRVKSLLFDLNPAINVTNNISNVYGNGPAKVLEIDAQSINQLYKSNSAFDQIEVIKLVMNSLNDLSISLDLSKVNSFSQLKYIYIEFAFDVCGDQSDICLPLRIKDMITGIDSNVIIIYKLSIPN